MKKSIEKIIDLVEKLNQQANQGKLEVFELPNADELDTKEKIITSKFDEILKSLDEIFKIYQYEILYSKSELVNLVKQMHTKFGITSEQVPFSKTEKEFRICAMQEELDEYKEAETKEDELDALVDLVVFAIGTAERQGMLEVFDEAFKRVMIANCKKEIGQNQKRGSFQLDLVKPEGWTAPDLSDLVNLNKDIKELENETKALEIIKTLKKIKNI